MSVKRIASRDNEFFRAWLDLAEKRQARRERGQTLLDGEHLVEEALRAGLAPRHLIVNEEMPGAEPWLNRLAGVPATLLSAALFKKLSPVASPTGLLAVIDLPKPATSADTRFAMLLEDVQDPGNLGSLLRTAAAAGVEAVHLSRGCAEAWSPKALRGGQGGHFRLRIHEGVDLAELARSFPGTVHAAALGSGQALYGLDLRGPVAFVFGNEGAGLSQSLLQEARPFTIPMAAEIESLNVAAAAAICLFERVRQQDDWRRMP